MALRQPTRTLPDNIQDAITHRILCLVQEHQRIPKGGKKRLRRALKGFRWLPINALAKDNVRGVRKGTQLERRAISAGKLFIIDDIYTPDIPLRRYWESPQTWNKFRAERAALASTAMPSLGSLHPTNQNYLNKKGFRNLNINID